MTLETIYECIRTAKSDVEVQRLEKMLDRIVGAIYSAQEALDESEQWEREDSEMMRPCSEPFTAKEDVFSTKEFVFTAKEVVA